MTVVHTYFAMGGYQGEAIEVFTAEGGLGLLGQA